MKFKKTVVLFFVLFFCIVHARSQQKDSSISSNAYIADLKKIAAQLNDSNDYSVASTLKKIIGKPLFANSVLSTIYKGEYDFSRRKRPAFVYFGFAGCHPCREQMPDFIFLSKKYPTVDFIYITFDEGKAILEEFEELKNKSVLVNDNFFVVSMSETEMSKRKLIHGGYPRKYFLNHNAIIEHAIICAELLKSAERLQQWIAAINTILQ